MNSATLTQLCERLCAVLVNLKKDGPNRKRSELSGQNKIKEVEEIYNEFKLINNSLVKSSLTVKEQGDIERIRRFPKKRKLLTKRNMPCHDSQHLHMHFSEIFLSVVEYMMMLQNG